MRTDVGQSATDTTLTCHNRSVKQVRTLSALFLKSFLVEKSTPSLSYVLPLLLCPSPSSYAPPPPMPLFLVLLPLLCPSSWSSSPSYTLLPRPPPPPMSFFLILLLLCPSSSSSSPSYAPLPGPPPPPIPFFLVLLPLLCPSSSSSSSSYAPPPPPPHPLSPVKKGSVAHRRLTTSNKRTSLKQVQTGTNRYKQVQTGTRVGRVHFQAASPIVV